MCCVLEPKFASSFHVAKTVLKRYLSGYRVGCALFHSLKTTAPSPRILYVFLFIAYILLLWFYCLLLLRECVLLFLVRTLILFIHLRIANREWQMAMKEYEDRCISALFLWMDAICVTNASMQALDELGEGVRWNWKRTTTTKYHIDRWINFRIIHLFLIAFGMKWIMTTTTMQTNDHGIRIWQE